MSHSDSARRLPGRSLFLREPPQPDKRDVDFAVAVLVEKYSGIRRVKIPAPAHRYVDLLRDSPTLRRPVEYVLAAEAQGLADADAIRQIGYGWLTIADSRDRSPLPALWTAHVAEQAAQGAADPLQAQAAHLGAKDPAAIQRAIDATDAHIARLTECRRVLANEFRRAALGITE